jgi:fused signal recognition particle receptor
MWLDVFNTALLIAFVVGFVWLGWAFLRKKRKERIALLTQVVEQVQAESLAQKPQTVVAPKALGAALAQTRSGWFSKLSSMLSGQKEIAEVVLEELEAVLFTADIGVRTSQKLMDAVRQGLQSGELRDGDKVKHALRHEIRQILNGVENKPLAQNPEGSPTVMMFVGVNGVGKTTTIGKIAHQLKGQGQSVLLGAGDTFRAAASEQLAIWAERTHTPIVQGAANADPASVLFEAVQKAKADNIDVVLCDTAGRLHTKVGLMEELKKLHRVLAKACPGAPHEVLLVLDATTGQNAIVQAKQFAEATPLTGIVLTKLDGTAKGGVVIGIANELGVPIRFIGIGEAVEDLRPFDANAFVDALFEGDAPAGLLSA